MFSPSRLLRIQSILVLALGLSACASVFGTPATPTPEIPTATPAPPSPTPPPLAAVVNGEYITLAEHEAELARYQSAQNGLSKTVTDDQAAQAVLDDLISQVLLSQGAREQGFNLTETDLQSRLDALAAQLGGEALAAWMSDHGYTDESFRASLKRAGEAAWMRDKIIADVPLTAEQVHVRQILSYNEEDAVQALQQLNDGADFDELAGSQFYDPTTHGELGWVPRGYLLDSKVEEAAFSLAVGSFSDVITTSAGFVIIKVLERDPQRVLSPDALLAMRERALQDWLAQRRDQSEINLAP